MSMGAFAAPILTISFNSPAGFAGNIVNLIATVTNTSATAQNLNGESITFNPVTPFTQGNIDATAFNNNWFLINGNSSQGPATIVAITIPGSATPGVYTGTFNLTGGPGLNDTGLIGTQAFSITVSAPEPASLSMLGGGLAMVAGLAARRKRKMAAAKS